MNKWAPIKATRNPTADEMRRWGTWLNCAFISKKWRGIMTTLLFPTWGHLIAHLAHSGKRGSVARKQGQWVLKEVQ